MSPADFSVDVWASEAKAVVRVAGEVDIATAPTLWASIEPILKRGRGEVVVDLSDTEFIDAAALRILVQASCRARSTGGTLRLRGASDNVRRVLRIAGLDHLHE